jgi:hypothetical protein
MSVSRNPLVQEQEVCYAPAWLQHRTSRYCHDVQQFKSVSFHDADEVRKSVRFFMPVLDARFSNAIFDALNELGRAQYDSVFHSFGIDFQQDIRLEISVGK